MNEYYYLVASLPHLAFGQQVPLERCVFLARCESQLVERDLEVLRAATLVADEKLDALLSPLPLARAYYVWERRARWELGALRAARRSVGFRPAAPDADYETIRLARGTAEAVMKSDDPLAGELAFEKARWERLEAAKNRSFFDMEWLFAYALQLLALSRVARFDAEAGEGRYKATYDAVLESAHYG